MDPSTDFDQIADVLIEGKKIKAIGTFEATEAMEVIDAKGLIFMPGNMSEEEIASFA